MKIKDPWTGTENRRTVAVENDPRGFYRNNLGQVLVECERRDGRLVDLGHSRVVGVTRGKALTFRYREAKP